MEIYAGVLDGKITRQLFLVPHLIYGDEQKGKRDSTFLYARRLKLRRVFSCTCLICCVSVKVRDVLAGTFNQLVKAVALAADADSNDGDDDGSDNGQDGRHNGRNGVSGFPSTELSADGQFQGRIATATAADGDEDEAAGDTVEEDGEVHFRRVL